MVALPITLDQPAVAARLLTLGVAEVLPMRNRSAEEIRDALMKVHRNPRYRDAAQKLASQLQTLRGLEHAADIIESRLGNLQPQALLDDISLTSR